MNDNIQTIGKYAFANTLLTGENGVLTIPAGVTTIGEGAYSGLASVESFAIGDNEKYFVESGMLYQRVPNGVQLIAFPAGSDGDNGKVELNAQTVRLGASAFENAKKIESVEFPYVFKSIGDVLSSAVLRKPIFSDVLRHPSLKRRYCTRKTLKPVRICILFF